jgi:hypothetical protein
MVVLSIGRRFGAPGGFDKGDSHSPTIIPGCAGKFGREEI